MKKQEGVGIERKASAVRHSVAPQNIDQNNWYYEEKNGIEVIHQVVTGASEYVQTDSIFIPWEKLTHTVRRHLGTYN